ncbi:MAG: hypothetical protein WC119_01980 [Synergistaceae bacterium]
MKRFWRGMTKDDKFVTEAQGTAWNEVASELKSLELVTENNVIKLPKGMKYIQAKTCGADLLSGECEIESRYLGFYLGNNTVIIRVDEKSGDISVEVS